MQLNEKALLVSLVISQWSARKFDRKATKEVNDKHNTTDAGRFNKALIATEHLQEIQKTVNAARDFHYENTLPWSDNGERLLPSTNYFKYCEELAKHRNVFESQVRQFASDYPDMIEEAKIRLNGLFNPADYPASILDKFAVKTIFMPIPQVSDVRLDMSAAEIDKIKAHVYTEVNERFAAAQADIFKRIKDQLEKMHERLSEKGNVFRNTLFDHVLELVELIPRLNVSGDANLDILCAELKTLYADPDAIRANPKLRAQKAQDVETMLASLDSFFKPASI